MTEALSSYYNSTLDKGKKIVQSKTHIVGGLQAVYGYTKKMILKGIMTIFKWLLITSQLLDCKLFKQ